VVRVRLARGALDRLPFSLLRFFWASKRNEGAHQMKFFNIANPKQKIYKHTLRGSSLEKRRVDYKKLALFYSLLTSTYVYLPVQKCAAFHRSTQLLNH
jgi:hypothetical protein